MTKLARRSARFYAARSAWVLVAWVLAAATSQASDAIVIWSRDAGVPAPIIEAFKAAHPEIAVENVGVPCMEFDDKLGVAIAGGVRIDVVLNPCMRQWPRYALDGFFTDLSRYVARDRAVLNREGVLPVVYQILRGPTGLSGVAFQMRTGLQLRYNATHLDEAGIARPSLVYGRSWKWEDFVQAAQKLTRKAPDGTVTRYGIDTWNSDLQALAFPWAWGGDLLPPEAYRAQHTDRVTFVTDRNVQAFEALAELSRLGVRGGSQQGFYGQRTSMWIDVGDGTMPATTGFPWGAAPFPLGPAGLVAMPTWPSYAGIPRTSEAPDAAWTFIRFLLTEGGTLRDETGSFWRGGATREAWQVRIEDAVANTQAVHSAGELLDFYLNGAGRYTRASVSDTIADIGPLISFADRPLWRELGKALQGEQSVRQALEIAQRETNALLEEMAARR